MATLGYEFQASQGSATRPSLQKMKVRTEKKRKRKKEKKGSWEESMALEEGGRDQLSDWLRFPG